ncbi:MAG: LysM domain-containing protein [Dehalococcoidia bacterium]
MDCYFCDAAAVQECARCGLLYCDSHGDALCQRCLDPMLALPSYRVYRGSLLTLLVGTVFAVWLLVAPLGAGDADGPVPPSISKVVGSPAATDTPAPRGGVASNPSGPAGTAAGAPPAPAATARPAEATSTAPTTYTVQSGDTLVGIATKTLPPGKTVANFVIEIQEANGIQDPATIRIGQTLRIPH